MLPAVLYKHNSAKQSQSSVPRKGHNDLRLHQTQLPRKSGFYKYNKLPDLILSTIVGHLDVEDRLNASIISRRFRQEVLRCNSMRIMQVSISLHVRVFQLHNLLLHVRNVQICIGMVKPQLLIDLLHGVLTYCDMLECLDISKTDSDKDMNIMMSERESTNMGRVTKLRASWYFSHTSCFKSLLRACTKLRTLTLTEPVCRFQFDDASRHCLADLPFDRELSDGADILYFNFFEFLAFVADRGVRMDQFLADDRVPHRGEQNEVYVSTMLGCVERAFEEHALSMLSLPRTSFWMHEAVHRILSRQAKTIRHFGAEFVDRAQVECVAQCVATSQLRSLELRLREPRLTSILAEQFFTEPRSRQLLSVSLTGVRWLPMITIVPRWSALRTLSLSHVFLSGADFSQLATECVSLQRLRLYTCGGISSFDFRGTNGRMYTSKLRYLVTFEVINCGAVTDDSFEFFKVNSLRKFVLHNCERPKARPRIWRLLADNCPQLASISLKHREECLIGQRQLDAILDAISSLKCLRRLVSFRYKLTKRISVPHRPLARCFGVTCEREVDYECGPRHHSTSLSFLEQLAFRFPRLRAELCNA